SMHSMPDVKFYVQKTSEVADEIYNSILEEEKNAEATVKEVYDVLDQGFKNDFKPFEKENGARVEFEVVKKEGKSAEVTTLEYDKNNNLIREAQVDGFSVKKITTYDSETCDMIEISHTKPVALYKGVVTSAKGLNGDRLSRIKAAYDFQNPDNKSVTYDININGANSHSLERKYVFNSNGKLDRMLFLHKENEDGSKESQLDLKFNPYAMRGQLSLDVVRKGVKIDAEGNLQADEIVEMHFSGEYPNKISKNTKQNIDGTSTSDHVYMFAGGKLLMAKSGEEKTREEYKAEKIYKFSRYGLDEYMEKCSMPIVSGKSQRYSCERKIEF
ncbi:hypothetical protein IKA15_04785, partial [bacterium]|nr:hypothetical protein [bacterium]